MKKATAVFDIGKTNKKFFLFDDDYQELHREYTRFDLIKDEDGHPTENLPALQKWLKSVFDKILKSKNFNIEAINFSTYGASFVHLDENGKILTPLYNYTKPMDQKVIDSFYEKYGPEVEFSVSTGSTNSGMLNSGMQLYWLKNTKPEIFQKIKYSLHLPQYISYVFTGIPVSEYTSIGCHTSLWDYHKRDYHDWVYAEGINRVLPPIVSTQTSINMNYDGNTIKIGVGIHDSSAALLPYLKSVRKKFILVSTGTWSIALNPFSKKLLENKDILNNSINYMQINGKPVKAARLFLGNEYSLQIEELSKYYKLPKEEIKKIKFNQVLFSKILKDFKFHFRWKSIDKDDMPTETRISSGNCEEHYHQLMVELVLLQIESIKTALGGERIKRLYIDGGFSDNELFVEMLSHYMRDMVIRTTDSSLGSALGAAIAISDSQIGSKFLKKNYSLKKHIPITLK